MGILPQTLLIGLLHGPLSQQSRRGDGNKWEMRWITSGIQMSMTMREVAILVGMPRTVPAQGETYHWTILLDAFLIIGPFVCLTWLASSEKELER
jgi:hypothetical protein